MKYHRILAVLFIAGIAIYAGSATFTDVNVASYWGRTDIPKLTAALDANFALIESGTTLNYGQVLLENGEIIDNASDAQVTLTFDDDGATLGTLYLKSSNAYSNMADNDLFQIIGQAYDDKTNLTAYATIQLRADDVTDTTEDGGILLKAFIGGTERTLATLGAANTVGASQATLALASSDWAIGATGDATGIGAITMDGTLTLPNGSTIANTAADTLTLTETKVNIVGQPQDDGKALVCAPSTTTLIIDRGELATNGATIAFNVTFGAVPTVVMGAAESTSTVPYPSSVTESNFVANGEAAKLLSWIAVGNR